MTRSYDVWYELIDRMGYPLTRASKTVWAATPEDAVAQIVRLAHVRYLHPVILRIQEWPR